MSYNAGDVIIMMMFGVLGLLLQKMAYEPGPLILAFILGPLMEQSFHQSLTISQGSFLIFVTRPLTLISLLMAAILLLTSILLPKRRAAIAVEES
jgi:putative tricarboxylic transport membrane protein